MYESHFGLRHRPFRSTPDGSCFYPASGHEDALAQLQRGLEDEEGLLLLSGEPGLGKTLLCQCLLERLGTNTRIASLTNGHIPDRVALLQSILYELGKAHSGSSEHLLRLALTDALLNHCGDGGTTLLLVDEAHHLGGDLLEELRLLANLESAQARAVQVILVAQPGIYQTLSFPALASLRQRLAVHPSLEPLGPAEAADYLLHHLRLATDRPERVIDPEALELLALGTRGVPRLLNQAAHRALMLACSASGKQVDAEAALEALWMLGLKVEDSSDGPQDSSRQAA
jgi:type II secretory pathway predicted ATPase ExeA